MTHKFLGAREGRNIKRRQEDLLFCPQRVMADNNNTLFVQPKGCFSSRRWRREGRLHWLRSLLHFSCSLQSCYTPACLQAWCSQLPYALCWADSLQPQMAPALHASTEFILILKAPVFQALSSWSLCSGKNNTPKQPGIYLICGP